MKGYYHLTYEQRCQIYALRKRGISCREIAKDIGVHHSTICREIQRNRGQKGYRHRQAQRLSEHRRITAPLKMTAELTGVIEQKLALQWSPQQISGWLKLHGLPVISHESIYQHIWQDKKQGGNLHGNLRHRGKKYHKRGSNTAGRGCIPGRVDIDKRPAIAERKERIGDWELDTIIGAGHQGVIVSMVDRASKLTLIGKVPTKTSSDVTGALLGALKPIKKQVHTLTADNGKEFAEHKNIAKQLGADFYFAKPYHSWERGLNEHTNGLVRQYFPKKTNLLTITEEALQNVENLLNNRPRAVLNFRTPAEVFFAKTGRHPPVALRT